MYCYHLHGICQLFFSNGILNNIFGISNPLIKVAGYRGKSNGLDLDSNVYLASYRLYEFSQIVHILWKTVSFSANKGAELDDFQGLF